MWGARYVALLVLIKWHGPHGYRGGVSAKPSVDPGLFMILGVESCRGGEGYCFLGLDCTLDDDFLPDDSNGHCNGLKNAFTPSAHFTCCKYNNERDNATTTKRPRPGHLKPTAKPSSTTVSSALVKSTTEVISTTLATPTETTEAATALYITEDVTTEVIATTSIWNDNEIFVDVNNEVFKEVVPPSLNNDTGVPVPPIA